MGEVSGSNRPEFEHNLHGNFLFRPISIEIQVSDWGNLQKNALIGLNSHGNLNVHAGCPKKGLSFKFKLARYFKQLIVFNFKRCSFMIGSFSSCPIVYKTVCFYHRIENKYSVYKKKASL